LKVLLDECIDRNLTREITGHTVLTVPGMGWAGKRNGELLLLAATEFDVFVTVDKNLSLQQDLSKLDLAVIVLVSDSNRLQDSRTLVPELLQVISSAPRGQATLIS
jgi:Domain of unknown function (DUF5615)